MMMPRSKKQTSAAFQIEDAFEESPKDKIRLYDHDQKQNNHHKNSPSESTSDTTPIVKNGVGVAYSVVGQNRGDTDETTSQDSTSLIGNNNNFVSAGGGNGGYYSGPAPTKYWWNHPKIRDNWKIVLAAFSLMFLGLGLIVTGIVTYFVPEMAGVQGVIFFIAGIICLLPGAYHIIYVYLAVKGKRGFEFHHLPLFN